MVGRILGGRRTRAWHACGLALSLACVARAPLRAFEAPVPVDSTAFHVASWGIGDGLPQSTVNDIVETGDGELWLATFGGLVRFDGVRFETFDLATLDGLPSNRITAMVADGENGLWLATQTGHVVHFADRRVDRDFPPSDPRTELVSLAVSSSGELFGRDAESRVLRIEADGHETLLAEGGEVTFHNLAVSPDGVVWAGAGRFLHRLEPGQRFEMPAVVTQIVPDGRGGLWIGLMDGLAHFDEGVARRVEVVPPVEGAVSVILPEGDDRLWISSPRGPIEIRRQGDGSWKQSARPFELPLGFGIRSMHRDATGNLWVGTNGEGLYRVSRRPFTTIRPQWGISQVTALASDGAGGAWMVLGCRGLFHAPAAGEVTEVTLRSAQVPYPGCEHSVALGAGNSLWVRAREHLFRVEPPANGSPASVARAPVGLPDQQGALVADPDGSLWIASRGGRLQRLAPGGELADVAEIGEEINSATLDPAGALWLGGRGALFRLFDGRIERFGEDQNVPPGAVRALLPEPDGGVLLGTYGGGIGWLRQGRALRLSTRQGLVDNSISGLLEDGRGRIWILGNQGISMIPRAELEAVAGGERERLSPVHFGPERGVSEGNFGSPAAFAGEAGRLWFGTIAGAVSIDAAEFPRHREPPRVRIESVELDGRRVEAAPRIEIPAGTARVRFHFSTVARTAPSRLMFRHRVEGLDPAWVEIGNQRFGGFTAAKPGTYRYLVQVRSEDGIWSERPAEVLVTVLPEWWQRPAVRLAAMACVAALLFGAHRLRLEAIQRRNRELVREIEERHRAEEESARLRRELEHVTRLTTAGELATSLAHEVNQPLAAIVSNAQAGRRFLAQGEPARAEVEQIFADIARQGQRASEVIQRLREFLRKEAPRRGSLDVNGLVRSILPLVRREIEERKIELAIELAPALPAIAGDRVQLQQVVINLIQNACEAMQSSPPPRRITLGSRVAAGAVELSVSDTGPGVPPAMAASIFEPFVSTKAAGMGIGLSICRSLVERHGGSLGAEPTPGGGATFRVRLPVEPAVEAAS